MSCACTGVERCSNCVRQQRCRRDEKPQDRAFRDGRPAARTTLLAAVSEALFARTMPPPVSRISPLGPPSGPTHRRWINFTTNPFPSGVIGLLDSTAVMAFCLTFLRKRCGTTRQERTQRSRPAPWRHSSSSHGLPLSRLRSLPGDKHSGVSSVHGTLFSPRENVRNFVLPRRTTDKRMRVFHV